MLISFYYVQPDEPCIDFGTLDKSFAIPINVGMFYDDVDLKNAIAELLFRGDDADNIDSYYWWYEEPIDDYYYHEIQEGTCTLLGTHNITTVHSLMQALHYYTQQYNIKTKHPELFI